MGEIGIDLHMHTIHSDGSKTVSELLDDFRALGIGIAAFTDHDSVGAYYDLLDCRDRLEGLTIVPGVEMSFVYQGNSRHMLGLGIDYEVINDFYQEILPPEKRFQRQEILLDMHKDNCRKMGIKFDESIRIVHGNTAESNQLIFREINKYPENIRRFPFITSNTRLYYDHFANKNSPLHIDETIMMPDITAVLDAIHRAGGLAFLAHPCGYALDRDYVTELIRYSIDHGIDGLEVKHASNQGDDVEYLMGFIKQYDLYISGGTDYHGANKPTRKLRYAYGNMEVEYQEIAPWINKVRHFG